MINKIPLTIFVFSLFCLSLSAQEKFYYSISGSVAKSSQVKKICVDYEIVGEKFNDCATVSGNRFNLKKQIIQPTSAAVSTDNATFKPLKVFLGNTEFVFNINGEISFVTKPKLQTEFEMLTVMDNIRPNYFTLYSELGEKNDERGLAKLSELFENFKQADTNISYIYFKNNPKSPLSIFAFERYAVFQSDYGLLDTEFSQLPELIKNSVAGKYISAKIEGAKSVVINKSAPVFSQITDGKKVGLEDLRGKYVLLDFWASWCVPCRKEHPNFVKLYEKYKSRNFEIISVSIDEDKNAWLKASQADGITWVNFLDIKGNADEIGIKYGVQAVPANFLINPQGVIIAKNLKDEELAKSLADLIK